MGRAAPRVRRIPGVWVTLRISALRDPDRYVACPQYQDVDGFSAGRGMETYSLSSEEELGEECETEDVEEGTDGVANSVTDRFAARR